MPRDLPSEDPLVRMPRDLKRALKKNPKDIKWGMVIGTARASVATPIWVSLWNSGTG